MKERSLSGFWREQQYDPVLEMVSVLQGSRNLIGLMGSDLRVGWSGNGMSYTNLGEKRVSLDYTPLATCKAPFPGGAVDEVIGYAAHEGGHCIFTAPDKDKVIEEGMRRQKRLSPQFRRAWTEGENHPLPDGKGGFINPMLVELCNIQNILEDAYVDTHVGRRWEVLGEHIKVSRQRMKERNQDNGKAPDLAGIARKAQPSRAEIVGLWVNMSLYAEPRPRRCSVRVRKALDFLMKHTEIAIQTGDAYQRQFMTVGVGDYLWRYFPDQEPEAKSQDDSGDGQPGEPGQDSQGSPGQEQEQESGDADDQEGDDDQETGGNNTTDDPDDDAQDQDQDGDDDDQEGDDDQETGGNNTTDDPDDDDPDGDATDATDEEAAGDGDDQEGDATGATGWAADGDDELGEIIRRLKKVLEEAKAKAEEAAGDPPADGSDDSDQDGAAPGLPVPPDGFDHEPMEVPEEILEAIADALELELEDLSQEVAEILGEDPRYVAAHAQKARYDAEKARQALSGVKKQVAEIQRAFDQQQQAATRYLTGLPKGKVNGSQLARVGAGDLNVYRRKLVLGKPDMDVGLLLDVSGSMNKWSQVVDETAAVFAEALSRKPGVNFAAWAYTDWAELDETEVQLTRLCDRTMGKLHLGDVVRNGGTPSGPAIAAVKVMMERMPGKSKLLIHFTDGDPNNAQHVFQAVAACSKVGIEVRCIALEGSRSTSLTSQYGQGNWQPIQSVADLPKAVMEIIKNLD